MIQPGLERIGLLLKNIEIPWKSIHVAGTNGKGSICAYASALLSRRTIRNGRFTSPHLVNRWDGITINDTPVSRGEFVQAEAQIKRLNEEEKIGASEFEILTATAFKLFTDKQVKVAVVEVGMGGKLDATNILNNQIVSVISKIARDHQDFLGSTLEEIAAHKAGILRPNVPYIVNPSNEFSVHAKIDDYANEIGAGPRLHGDTEELRNALYSTKEWHTVAGPLRPFQRDNMVLALLAVLQVLDHFNMPGGDRTNKLILGLRNKRFGGRLQLRACSPVFGESSTKVLVDGAHNPDAAQALSEFVYHNLRYTPKDNKRRPSKHKNSRKTVSPKPKPVTWVIAMTAGKDARGYLETLLMPGDNVVTTVFDPVDGMPWVKPMDPKELLDIALEVQPDITGLAVPEPGAFRALSTAKYLANNPVVLTGSLYFVSTFERERENFKSEPSWATLSIVRTEERNRVTKFFSKTVKPRAEAKRDAEQGDTNERTRLEAEIARIDEEMRRLQEAEPEIGESFTSDGSDLEGDDMVASDSGADDLGSNDIPEPRFRIVKHYSRNHNISKEVGNDRAGSVLQPNSSPVWKIGKSQ
ncbi:Mur ligase [Corynespora cassiicola Philippines]|uniref:Mur ligase n=1 Tax=Corynespora cassiicola Philippines TaxID=1448308 RepID=A0A2T2NFB9_CORCC|nr:Mur ligase [Corynespora cassiicola Philippines]